MKKLTLEEFISKARKIHGDKYDYSKVEYVNARTKVCIICPIHGYFFQTPADHLNGGCKKCGTLEAAKKRRLAKEEFIQKAKGIHGDKYDYSKVEYKNNQTKVCIICKEHGEFWQIPFSHLSGKGCPKCVGKDKNTSDFVFEAKKVHNNKYDYSKVQYNKSHEKVCILCYEHGEFWQTPANHLQGQGCPKCKRSKLEENIKTLLIENNIRFEEQKRFKWLGKKSLDFYLPDYSVAIECQGKQHFGYGGWSDKYDFDKQFKLDEVKHLLCSDMGVNIIYYSNLSIKYPYDVITDKNKLLEKIKDYAKQKLG